MHGRPSIISAYVACGGPLACGHEAPSSVLGERWKAEPHSERLRSGSRTFQCSVGENGAVMQNQATLPSLRGTMPARRYDIIVCGGGSAVCVVASRLAADRDITVLLLEAGDSDDTALVQDPNQWPRTLGTALDWNYRTDPNPRLKGRSGPLRHGPGARRRVQHQRVHLGRAGTGPTGTIMRRRDATKAGLSTPSARYTATGSSAGGGRPIRPCADSTDP